MIKKILQRLDTIKIKISMTIIVIIFIVFNFNMFLSRQSEQESVIEKAKTDLTTQAKILAEKVNSEISQNLNIPQNLSRIMSVQGEVSLADNFTRNQINNSIRNILLNNPKLSGIGSFWEPNRFDKLDTAFAGKNEYDKTGAFVLFWRNDGKGNVYSFPNSSCYISDYYLIPKKTLKDFVQDPSLKSVSGREQLMTFLVSPIVDKGQFLGVNVMETNLTPLQEFVANSHFFKDQAEVMLISNNGTIAAHKNKPELIGKSIRHILEDAEDQIAEINSGIQKNFEDDDIIEIRTPVLFQNTENPWQLRVSVQKSVILNPIRQETIFNFVISLIILVAIIWIILLFFRYLFKPVYQLDEVISDMAIGKLSQPKEIKSTGKEVDSIIDHLSELYSGLSQKLTYVQDITKNNLNTEFEPKSQQDQLGYALLNLKYSLIEAEMAKQQQKEQIEKDNWMTEGLAKFNDILRRRSENIEEISYQIISSLINYLNANQGALFLYNDENKEDIFLELTTAVAYDDKRFLEKRIELGDGLVGTCALEKKTILLTKLPDDYIEITSGLGTANPTNLLITPLLLNEQIFGIVELASFTEFKPHEIAFVEKLAESIASTLSSSKINQRTAELLAISMQQADEMSAQEEELRQNLEEMATIQENLERKNHELDIMNQTVDSVLLVAEYHTDGTILYCNENYSIASAYTKSELIGKSLVSEFDDNEQNIFVEIFQKVLRGNLFAGEVKKVKKDASPYFVYANFVPIVDDYGKVFKIKFIGQDITHNLEIVHHNENLQAESEGLKRELKYSLEKIEILQKNIEKREVENKKKLDKLNMENELKVKALSKIAEQEKDHYKAQYEEILNKYNEFQILAYKKEQQLNIELKACKDEIVKNRLNNQPNND
jgi:methyl-accepting chemotaxis protein